MAPLSSPHRTRVAQALCELLDQTATIFPGSRLRMRFAVRPLPCIGLAFPGPPAPRSTTPATASTPLSRAETGHFCKALCQEVWTSSVRDRSRQQQQVWQLPHDFHALRAGQIASHLQLAGNAAAQPKESGPNHREITGPLESCRGSLVQQMSSAAPGRPNTCTFVNNQLPIPAVRASSTSDAVAPRLFVF